ncbi:hypothetical protein BH09ACT5_BH09ACT5_19930 [soil metagenome]
MSHPKASDFHARKRPALRLILPLAAGVLALATVWSALPEAPARAVAAPEHAVSDSTAVELPTLALPAAEPAVEPVVETAAAAAPAPAPASWSIGISAFGWQNELDACQWVLMDMVASVPLPIVAAHNYCGGGIVLEMQVGDTVTLGGYGYDGTYVVTGDRDAWSGGDAAEAIAGMGGDVILQTCYWDDDGTERLVSLQRIG